MLRRISLPIVSASLLAGLGSVPTAPAASAARSSDQLNGAGSSLVTPILVEWAQAYQVYYGTQIAYNPAGDSAGLSALSQHTADFAATDSPLSGSESGACSKCVQIPWALSAVGISYNLPGVRSALHLTSSVLADIYLGRITRWDDRQIKALNPRAKLPAEAITPIYAKSSGDTLTFTSYLSKVSSSWRSKIGSGNQVSFPTGISATGDAGLTTVLENTRGGIAYIGVPYLITHGLPTAAMENAAVRFVLPNFENILAAAGMVKRVPAGNAIAIIDPPSSLRKAYPISTFMYAVVPGDSSRKGALRQWIGYAIGAGQRFAAAIDFVPLPDVVLRASRAALARYK